MEKPTSETMKEWIEDIKRKAAERKKAIADGKIINKDKDNEDTGISK